ncbi:unnamed protein product [Medioppia subpectinata]|uniref:SLC41A/MgtE integral membrane domain-containing protein n=1 Tax=Medioppia subpectinata TaxID=1979941 RepID=A0A7R9Q0W4_9ACAR|nr:unnamed protein product [Medioppia subpectinata]CAG2108574.1 unnamed protein product [Medioppia subpectinata]
MDPSVKQFYLGDEDVLPTLASVEIVVDECTPGVGSGPDHPFPTPEDTASGYVYTDCQTYCFYNNDCLNGAITPESKNSSNASLISSNSTAKEGIDFTALQTIVESAIPPKGGDGDGLSSVSGVCIHREEALLSTSVQIFIAFIIAGFGNVGAGLILDNVQNWTVFVSISEMFVLVPSLLGLKGNLEMTMAARLSTHANLGNMQNWKQTLKLAKGNIALVQCQATIVSALAAIIAIIWSSFGKGIILNNCLTLLASSLITANVACFALVIPRKIRTHIQERASIELNIE